MAAPTGGTLLIASWLALAVAAAWPRRMKEPFSLLPLWEKVARSAPDEGSLSAETDPHPSPHFGGASLPQGERGKRRFAPCPAIR